MALANFFEKAKMSAAHVLQNFDDNGFETKLKSETICIEFDEAVCSSSSGLLSLDLLVRLLARLYPRLAIIGPPSSETALKLRELAHSINPDIRLLKTLQRSAHTVALGNKRSRAENPIYIGSDGWIARVSTRGPVGTSASINPFGAGAAACLGAANIFRKVFSEGLPKGDLDHEISLSLLDYSTGKVAANAPEIGKLDLGTAQIVGCGAIGNAAIWALSRVANLKGVLELIDHEEIELSNLQRYVLATQEHVTKKRSKVWIAKSEMKGSKLKAICHEKRWAEYVNQTNTWTFENVAVAVDSVCDRLGIQGSLPRRITNAWTQIGDIGVSRHEFLGEEACLACLYLPKGEMPNEDELVALAIGMTEDDRRMQIREMLLTGRPVGLEFVKEVAERTGIPENVLAPYADESLSSFYSQGICGAMVLQGTKSDQREIEVPLAFQSALAGIMLAAELVVEAGAYRTAKLPTKTTIDLTRPLADHLSVMIAKAKDGPRCICQDYDFQTAYKSKYGSLA